MRYFDLKQNWPLFWYPQKYHEFSARYPGAGTRSWSVRNWWRYKKDVIFHSKPMVSCLPDLCLVEAASFPCILAKLECSSLASVATLVKVTPHWPLQRIYCQAIYFIWGSDLFALLGAFTIEEGLRQLLWHFLLSI